MQARYATARDATRQDLISNLTEKKNFKITVLGGQKKRQTGHRAHMQAWEGMQQDLKPISNF